mgnify:CR=1 FL=1
MTVACDGLTRKSDLRLQPPTLRTSGSAVTLASTPERPGSPVTSAGDPPSDNTLAVSGGDTLTVTVPFVFEQCIAGQLIDSSAVRAMVRWGSVASIPGCRSMPSGPDAGGCTATHCTFTCITDNVVQVTSFSVEVLDESGVAVSSLTTVVQASR